MNDKLDRINERVNNTALDTELQHETLLKLLPNLVEIVEKFIWPIMSQNVVGLREKQPQLQKLFNGLESSLSYLKSDYSTRRKRISSPPPRLSPSEDSTTTFNKTATNASIQNMNS
ncbi:unnamed protein product [Rotaria magnacalcarata]|uniref:Uncharacterized protein n=1 Tax=Rotaria magnacalcarata TaxID=392030 RepID=A0A816L237_9BILA|nr:unnamed protein product [Rotaria magnacalcarata]CAF5096438.1 unnamed protein product [Rotaria magnacalcarata]